MSKNQVKGYVLYAGAYPLLLFITTMARTIEWVKYQLLQAKINEAIEDAMADAEYGDCDAPLEYAIFISPDLENVVVCLDGDWDWELERDGWFVETATNYDDAVEVAEKFFDLR